MSRPLLRCVKGLMKNMLSYDGKHPVITRVAWIESGDVWIYLGYIDMETSKFIRDAWNVSDWHGHGELSVPVGFRFDGASIPWFLRFFTRVGSRDLPDVPVMIHDYIYENRGVVERNISVTRKEADNAFYEELKQGKYSLSSWKPVFFGRGVRLAFWKSWGWRGGT